MRQLGAGAEATVWLIESKGIPKGIACVLKERVAKRYRHPELDAQLRQARTRREAKILAKLPVRGPKHLETRDSAIEMEFLEGAQLKSRLDSDPLLAEPVGVMLARTHDAGIVHGDLTTSNILVLKEQRAGGRIGPQDPALAFIDFGLSAFSKEDEDKAVDIHLFRQSLESKHYRVADAAYAAFLKGYRAASPNAPAVLSRLRDVERRGRNKARMGG